jgi:hypothetical protein
MKVADPYTEGRFELKIWREDTPWRPWRGNLTVYPIGGFGIPMSIGNEYTGLLYGWSRSSIVRQAEKGKRMLRPTEPAIAEAIDL